MPNKRARQSPRPTAPEGVSRTHAAARGMAWRGVAHPAEDGAGLPRGRNPRPCPAPGRAASRSARGTARRSAPQSARSCLHIRYQGGAVESGATAGAIVGGPGSRSRQRTPLCRHQFREVKQLLFFFFGPLSLLDGRVEPLVPSRLALLGRFANEQRRDARPLVLAIFHDGGFENLILPNSPRPQRPPMAQHDAALQSREPWATRPTPAAGRACGSWSFGRKYRAHTSVFFQTPPAT